MATQQEAVVERIALTSAAEFACYPPGSEQLCWAVTSLKAPFYEPTSRAPVDIVAVIDKSGSMSGQKLELVKKTLHFVLEQLKECDRLSVVTYDTNMKLDFALTKMDKTNKERSTATINGINDGSSTNLCGGLIMGMEQLISTPAENRVRSVLLLTDGLANQGITTKDAILQEMRKYQGPKFDATVYTFGFGSDHDATLLEAISTQGNGVYYYIDSHEKIPESFADCLGGLLSVVGQNVSLKLEAVGDNAITTVHANRTINWSTPNKSCEIPMGDIQSEEEKDIVLELTLPATAAPQPDEVLRASLSYFNVITTTLDTVTCELTISRTDGERGPPNESVVTQRNRIVATDALKQAETLADQGKLSEAKTVLRSAIVKLEGSATGKNEYCMALIDDLKRSEEGMKSRAEYAGHGKLYMRSKAQSHGVQRSNFVDHQVYYQNASKVAFRKMAKK